MNWIQTIRNEYDRLDKITGVNTSAVQIRLSGRMTKTLGQFKTGNKRRGIPMEIVISKKVCGDEELFLDVIRHEYAHMIVYLRAPEERHVHDHIWKNACIEVGCIPKATRKVNMANAISKTRPYRYLVKCQKCGAESKYKTEAKVIKILLQKQKGKVFCTKCHSTDFTVFDIK